MKGTVDWDKQAANYQQVFKTSWKSDYNDRLMAFFKSEFGLKAGDRVIDIGCGVGKYGTYFASMGCDVTLTDISYEMLRHARENMAPFNTPCSFLHCDFDEAQVDNPLFSPKFKLSISTMSPAIHDEATVKKVSAITEGWCFMSRFASWRQDIRDKYYCLSGTEPLHSMSTERMQDDVNEMLSVIETAGYIPNLRYEEYNWMDLRTPREAALRFAGADAEETEILRAEETVKKLCNLEGMFEDAVQTRVAWIYWRP